MQNNCSKSCLSCTWKDQCHEETPCQYYEPTDVEAVVEAEFLRMRSLYQKDAALTASEQENTLYEDEE